MVTCPVSSVLVVGYGVIGASIAAAVKQRDPTVRVEVADHVAVLQRTAAERHVHRAIPVDDLQGVVASASAVDLVVLAAPVGVIEAQLPLLLPHARLVTDCGSTKRTIVAAAAKQARAGYFVGGHPMAGRTSGGAQASCGDLFVDRTWILSPAQALIESYEVVERFVRFLGARVVEMSAEEHDWCVARTSHLPQLLASLLLVSVHEATAQAAAGPAFQSATRVAGGNPAMWRDIFSANADCIAQVSAAFAERLREIATALEQGEVSVAVELLQAARSIRSEA